MFYYDGNRCEIISSREVDVKKYCDILLNERNVELTSLHPLDGALKENRYAIYIKNDVLEIVIINKIDFWYGFAYVQIYKSNVPAYFITEN